MVVIDARDVTNILSHSEFFLVIFVQSPRKSLELHTRLRRSSRTLRVACNRVSSSSSASLSSLLNRINSATVIGIITFFSFVVVVVVAAVPLPAVFLNQDGARIAHHAASLVGRREE
jgi:hypothetical protein